MSQLDLGDAVPRFLYREKMTLENVKEQKKETNVHDRPETQGPGRVRQKALGSEGVCTSLQ